MARRKCVCCGEFIENNDNSVPYKGRHAHINCFNTAMKTLKSSKDSELKQKEKKKAGATKKKKAPAELKDGMTEEEYAKKKKYYDYVRSLLNEPDLSTKIFAVSENLIKRYGFTFVSMYWTLVYLKEIKDYAFEGDIVGIIPYYHDEAQKYYESIKQVEETNKNFDMSNSYHRKVVTVKPRKRTTQLLDITSITEGE